MTFQSFRMKINKDLRIRNASDEETTSPNIGDMSYNEDINACTHSALGSISKVFNQMDFLGSKLTDNLSVQDRSVYTTPVKHFPDPETETLNQATSCSVLPDYLLVTTTVTEIYPVSATMLTTTNMDCQGREIPVRLTGHRDHQQPFRFVYTILYSSSVIIFQEKNSY